MDFILKICTINSDSIVFEFFDGSNYGIVEIEGLEGRSYQDLLEEAEKEVLFDMTPEQYHYTE